MPSPERALRLNDLEYLDMPGLSVMLAHDVYPEGHQGGVVVIQNGRRVATNGDLRFDDLPGQWSAIPKVGARSCDPETGGMSVDMAYPDPDRNGKGFNPIEYPDVEFSYRVAVIPEGQAFRIRVDLDRPLPPEWESQVGLNLELFPGWLFGKTFCMDGVSGLFPRFPGGPAETLSQGAKLVVAPEDDSHRMSIERLRGGELCLQDARVRHNNGWFVVRSLVEPGATQGAAEWLISPHAIEGWRAAPTIQASQVGYAPNQPKVAVLELDPADAIGSVSLLRISPEGGRQVVLEGPPAEWGRFLRSRYATFDFTAMREEGMYVLEYGGVRSSPFSISREVYRKGVWQPTVDTFLPVQMCHVRVVENYRVWHGACHLDDARMAPTGHNHFDGYLQGDSTLTEFAPGDRVPGLDRGGWHDAGDYDLRVESQAATVHGLALAYEEFGLDHDDTTVDQEARTVWMRRPDGKPDVLQQVEHGLLSILGGRRSLGRLYRGIIEPTLKQYVHLGDAATQTDNVPGNADDRWVFTEDNPRRELGVAASLAAAARVVGALDAALASECLQAAVEIGDLHAGQAPHDRALAALELLLATGEARYRDELADGAEEMAGHLDACGWILARASLSMGDARFTERVGRLIVPLRDRIAESVAATPYGVPYRPDIWGAGWGIQRFGFRQYWLHRAFPNLFGAEPMFDALHFMLGRHPGPNPCSLVSGVGARSLIPGYGVNRADEACIPGGVASGTALIRPDFPELLEWPYLWQQSEYCVGYPTSDFVFLAAAADSLLSR